MSLTKKTTKRGGCSYATVNNNYNLLQDAIKQPVKTGGCDYADVKSSYNLLDIPTSIKGGRKGGKCVSYTDINSSYMLNEQPQTQNKGGRKNIKKGGYPEFINLGRDLLNQTNAILNNPALNISNDSTSTPTTTQATTQTTTQATTQATTQPITPTTEATKSGGCGCSNARRNNFNRGGAVELAPFAAAIALMAARYMSDEKMMNLNEVFKSSTPKSSSKKTIKKISSKK